MRLVGEKLRGGGGEYEHEVGLGGCLNGLGPLLIVVKSLGMIAVRDRHP